MIPRPPNLIEPRPTWLKAAQAAVASVHFRNPGVRLDDAQLLLTVLAMAELEELEGPAISADPESGFFAVWSRGTRSFAVNAREGRVDFFRFWNDQDQPIPPSHVRGGRAVQIRELICWVFGYPTYRCRGIDLLAAAEQGDLRV